ncbi:MAG: class I SAM-dependent methyltransferase [Anaerolineae bacterium]|nr:class I SAM-dependent methyltransferase [Anaerolineae bacterium]MDW8098483.1 class I SAM-dependent methyltransferase [Anaerolineae bacterium]
MSFKTLYENSATEGWASHYRYLAPLRRLQETVALCLEASPQRMLDIGCGDGVLLALLQDQMKADRRAQLVGVDLSEGRLKRARKRLGSTVSCADAARLPFATETFDLCLCAEVLEHLPDPDAALIEWRRITRTGGRLVLTVPVVGWSRWIEARLTKRVRFLNEIEHLREYAPVQMKRCVLVSELVRALERAGWRVIGRQGVYYYPHRGERFWNAIFNREPLLRIVSSLDRWLGSRPSLSSWGRYLILECIRA